MKTKPILSVAFISAFQFLSVSAFSQGSLTPPGAPAPTMKTLDQIEARTPISIAPFTISTSGSYYLAKNLTVASGEAVTIDADDVTLNLNGFTISSTASPASGTAIFLTAQRRGIHILNGHIRGAVTFSSGTFSGNGFANGIFFTGFLPRNTRVSNVSIMGVGSYGIHLSLNNSTVVESCTVQTAGIYGLVASSISNSTAVECGNAAVTGDTVTNSYGATTASAPGVDATNADTCYGVSVSGNGINANNAINCYGSSTSGTGISATNVTNSRGISNSGAGINCSTASSCQGTSSGPTTLAFGIHALMATNCIGTGAAAQGLRIDNVAFNCRGESNSQTGIVAPIATYCYGLSVSGSGISAQIATGCIGQGSGTAIFADIAIGCISGGGTINCPSKWLGTP